MNIEYSKNSSTSYSPTAYASKENFCVITFVIFFRFIRQVFGTQQNENGFCPILPCRYMYMYTYLFIYNLY